MLGEIWSARCVLREFGGQNPHLELRLFRSRSAAGGPEHLMKGFRCQKCFLSRFSRILRFGHPQASKAKRAIGVRVLQNTPRDCRKAHRLGEKHAFPRAFPALVLYPPTCFKAKMGDWCESCAKKHLDNVAKPRHLIEKHVFSRICCFSPLSPHRPRRQNGRFDASLRLIPMWRQNVSTSNSMAVRSK